MIPLRPVLDQRAVRIDNQDAVLKPRLALRRRNAECAISPRIALRRFLRNRQLSTLKQDDAVGILRKNTALRSPSPARMPQRFWPAGYDFVRPSFILAAFFLRPCGGLPSNRGDPQCPQCNACTHPEFHFILQLTGLSAELRPHEESPQHLIIAPHPGRSPSAYLVATLLHWHPDSVHTIIAALNIAQKLKRADPRYRVGPGQTI